MSLALGKIAEQRRIIDIDAVCRDLVALKFEHIGERNTERGTIVAPVSHHSFAYCRRSAVPDVQQLVPARGNGREETRHGAAYGIGTDDRRCIAEAEPCVRCQQIDEGSGVAGVNDREKALPPGTIGQEGLRRGGGAHGASRSIRFMAQAKSIH
jgi:hypothetical protein